ncbi:MAG: (2Fe-2S)-binding protein [Gammaproteobacteria bacterium]|nr:(2Fe-2S)-binding protein [Gammaproteobacteria bacterium]
MARLTVNTVDHDVASSPDTPLLWVLRDELGLTGTKYACGKALCGACTVFVDGSPVRACVTPLAAVGRRPVTTIEGADSRVAEAVRRAWIELEVAQCGYCQSGQVMSAIALLEGNPNPDAAAVDRAMDGNLCRCATYARIRRAVRRAAELLA